MTDSSPALPADSPVRKTRWLRLLGLAGGTYLGVLLLLLLLENSLVYFPLPASASWEPPPAGVPVEDVWVQTPDGTRIHGWYFPKQGATAVLLYCHGNAGNLSHRGPAAPPIMDALNVSVLLFDYPGYGRSEGSPSEAGCYAAADAMVDWLIEVQHVPAKQVILFGKSLGGGIATDLAVRRPHRALVLVKCFTSIPDMAQRQFPFLPARWLVRNKFDNLAKIGRCRGPVAVAHGERDEIIPYAMGQRLYEAAPQPKRFFPLPGAGHNDGLPRQFFQDLAAFLQEAAR